MASAVRNRARRVGVLFFAMAMAATAMVLPASAAQAASGGGCSSWGSWQTGQYSQVRIKSCISFSSLRVRPDYYSEGNNEANCEIREQLYLNDQATGLTHVYPCVTEHRGPWPYRVLPPSGNAYLKVRIVFAGTTVVTRNSPRVYFP
jgi:hypothetical protein